MFFFENLGPYDLNELSAVTVLVRVFACIVCSGLIGFERSRKRRPAGVRTYVLVCLGASLTMMTSQYINTRLHIGITDPARLGAQVISGIGFIGAGTILFNGYHQIKGLTTAAGLWVSGCIGLAIGVGFIFGALVICICMFFVMLALDKVENHLISKAKRIRLFLMLGGIDNLQDLLISIKNQNMKIVDFETTNDSNKISLGIYIMIKIPQNLDHKDAIEIIRKFRGVKFIEEV